MQKRLSTRCREVHSTPPPPLQKPTNTQLGGLRSDLRRRVPGRGRLPWAAAAVLFMAILGVSIPSLAASRLLISEFMANNNETLIDDDDDRSDWIEIHNPTKYAVELSGWYLTDTTDDHMKWPFPSMTLRSGGYLVVFASQKDRRSPGAPLHTNFRLAADGDYLALFNPDTGELVEFFPTFVKQYADISYGVGLETTVDLPLVPLGAPARAWIPTNDKLALFWTQVGFTDSFWLSGTTGVGYDYGNLIGLDVSAMQGVNETVYVRIPFRIESLQEYDSLILRLQYEDGMIAYLNGQPIASDNIPDFPTWNSAAPFKRSDSTAVIFVEIDVSSAMDLLREGDNVLAFHVLNDPYDDTDLLLRPELVATTDMSTMDLYGYLLTPSPGGPNGAAVPHVTGSVQFSSPSRTFVDSFVVGLELPDDADASSEIRYTTDGGIPDRYSRLYTKPFTLKATTQVRAKVFEPSGGEGPVASETYVALSPDVLGFSSNLPVVMLETFGGGSIPQNSKQFAFMAIFEPGDARSSLAAAPALTTRSGIKVRGSSTAGRPKPSLGVEAWNEVDDDKNISPLGMPPESDWVLWGPYEFDLALMRNPLIYELSNQVGRYATRGRFVEVFLNTGGGAMASADYFGVYALIEKISRDEDRVDIEKLFPEHDREPEVSGGYMFKIDRADPGDGGFVGAGQSLMYVYPKEVDIERPERDPQEQYVRSFFSAFGTALNGTKYTDPEFGYRKYFDVQAAVDHHILNILTKNPDALRLSTYMYKPRGGKLTFGPIWDFDRTMGSTDGRDADPLGWQGGTDFFNFPWWGRMFTDPDFFQEWIDRWHLFRQGPLSNANMTALVDAMADELREAQVRNLDKWHLTPRYGGYQGEVDHLKTWLTTRGDWIDSQFVTPPLFSSNGGQITPGFMLAMEGPEGGTIYYTIDGSDPRLSGEKVSPKAIRYLAPITLKDTTQVTARVFQQNNNPNPNYNVATLSDWSAPVRARFSLHPSAGPGNLVITEINYHPLDPTVEERKVDPLLVREDFEFIELKNIGQGTLDLAGLEFTNGIIFSFADSSVLLLHPGECVVVVKNLAAYLARYGNLDRVAGVYEGSLDNAGERVRLQDGAGETILDFRYEDNWHPLTDGFGFSLVILNEGAPATAWGERDSWRSSTTVGGSPGQDDPPPLGISTVLINEALTHTAVTEVDVIELYNPTDAAADIGGWFLTDERGDPRKFRIPDGTVIPPREYRIFDGNDFNPTPPSPLGGFGLSSLGEEVYLFSADFHGNLTGYLHGFRFGAADDGVPFGRHVISTGQEHFVAQEGPSFDNVNPGPRVGPVVINEIMYAPPGSGDIPNTRDEYIELRNITASEVPLFDSENAANTWRLGGGVEFAFPEGVTLPSEGFLLVVGFDPVADTKARWFFCNAYGLDTGIPIFGPYTGRLENSGEGIELLRPIPPDEGEQPGGETAYAVVDRVDYSNGSPWPEDAEETGNSIQRLASEGYGNDPLNWQAAFPTPTEANAEGGNLDVDEDGLPNHWESAKGLNPNDALGDQGASGDPDGDGLTNEDEYVSGTHPLDAASMLKIDAIHENGVSLVMRFTAVAGKSYSVLYRDAFSEGPWLKLSDVPPQLETVEMEIHDPGAVAASQRFYRIVTPGQP